MTDILRVSGLATDPSPLLTAQAGGLRAADEITISRPGVAEQRTAFEIDTSKDVARAPKVGLAYGQGPPIWATLNGADWQLESTSTLFTGTIDPLDDTISLTQSLEARGNLYVAAEVSKKLVTTSASAVSRVGLPEAANVIPATSGSGSGYANLDLVAYRVCIVRIDASNVYVRSAPSPPSKHRQASGAAADILLDVLLPAWVDAGDIVEVYRTRVVNSSASIDDATSDVMYLHISHTVTSAEASNGVASLTDTNNGGNDDLRGPELYTNSTREGILASNYDPPGAVACASWLGCSWWGNVQNPQRVVLTVTRAPGYFTTTATFGTPVTDITVASAADLAVGMWVSENAAGTAYGTYVASGTRITAISGTTVTISQATVGSGAGVSLYFHDVIAVGSDVYYATSTEDINNRRFLGASGGTYYSGIRTVLDSFCEVVARYSTGSGPANDYYAYVIMDLGQTWTTPGQTPTLVIRKTDPTTTAMTVDVESLALATYGSAAAVQWSPSFGNDSSALEDTTYRYTNRLYYSKPDEPEHVPLVNYLRLGDDDNELMALTPMRSALLAWTTDGTYRVSGSPPQSWRVDLVDPATRLVYGRAVDTDGPYAYAWTDRGVYRVDESGLGESLTDGLIDEDLALHTRRVLQVASDSSAAWVRCWRRGHCVLVGVPSTSVETSGDVCAWIYVYNLSGGGWSRWLVGRSVYDAYADVQQGRLYVSMADQVYEWHTRINADWSPGSPWHGYDEVHALTVGGMTRDSDTQFTITDAARAEWIPRACDWVSATPEGAVQWFRVTAVVDNGVTYTVTVDGTLPGTLALFAWAAYEGIESVVQWQGLSAGSPGMTMRTGDLRTLEDWSDWETGFGPSTIRTEIGATTDRVGTEVEQVHTQTPSATPSTTLRIMLGRDVARCAHLYPRWSRCALNLPWRLLGISAKVEPISERTDR